MVKILYQSFVNSLTLVLTLIVIDPRIANKLKINVKLCVVGNL